MERERKDLKERELSSPRVVAGERRTLRALWDGDLSPAVRQRASLVRELMEETRVE